MRKSTLTALAFTGLAALAIACGSSGGGSTGGSSSSKAPAAAKVGSPARDGKFEFTVTKVTCGLTKIGTGYAVEKPQGQFCVVAITVKNIGTEAQTFSGSDQKAMDDKGTQFSDSTAAELTANSNSQTFLEQINPGNQVQGVLVFDVPKGTKLTKLELHDSPFSGGVEVTL